MVSYLTRYEQRIALVVALVSAAVVGVSSRARVSSNPGSRMATMDALVHDGTFAIDQSVFIGTVDKVRYDDHYYSTKPPLLSVVGAGVYKVFYVVTGQGFRNAPYVATRAMNLVFGLGFHVILLLYAWRVLRRTVAFVEARLLGLALFGGGLLLVGYATTVNNHTPAATMIVAAFYHAYCARHGRETGQAPLSRDFALAGLFAALAPTLDFPALFFSIALGLYVLVADAKRALTYFAPLALVPLGVHFLLTYLQTGGLVPIYLKKDLYLYPGSYWNTPMGIDTLREPWPAYLLHMLLGHHGIFVMTPLLLLGVWQAARVLRGGGLAHLGRAEALVALLPFLVLVIFYTATTSNYGGLCVGFRWLFIAMPLLALFGLAAYSRAWPVWGKALFVLALVIGAAHTESALRNPWSGSRWQRVLMQNGLAGELQMVSSKP